MPDPEPYEDDDGRIRIADPHVSQFGTDEPEGYGTVTVSRDDLRAVLAVAYDLAGRSPQFGRLAEAAGVVRR